uniref:hypothetical protein n=1 Tax=Methylobacterium sp. B34 TaxID=95563 RepID=UPI0005B26187
MSTGTYNQHRDALWREIVDPKVIAERRPKAVAAWDNSFMLPLAGAEPEYDGPHMRMMAHFRDPASGRWFVADRLLTTPEMLRVTPELVRARITTAAPPVPSRPKPAVITVPPEPTGMAPKPKGRGRRIALRLLSGLGLTGGVALSRAFPGPGPVIAVVCRVD